MIRKTSPLLLFLLPVIFIAQVQPAPSNASAEQKSSSNYFPGSGDNWERRKPEDVGMNSELLNDAINFANTHETPWPKDLAKMLAEGPAREPDGEIVGPAKERGGVNGIILRHGYIVAEWGDTSRVDMTFSSTKSYVSTMAGLAFDRGLIKDINDPVKNYVKDGQFDSPHNSRITWHHLLQQTSEWEGTLFGKPDTADRRKGRDRKLEEPGTFYEYNDVRVNRASLAVLQVWKRYLPDLLKELVMDPIGASSTWQWHGYRTSDVVIEGRKINSVSGGGHWGGGLWINTRDHARFGYLFLRRGKWKDRQLISEKWIDMATTPTKIYPQYGYMWWLNTNQKMWPGVPPSSFAALGGNVNTVVAVPDHDLVIVVRWINNQDLGEFLKRVVASVKA